MYLDYQGRTHPGRVRDVNEDNFYYRVQSSLGSETEGLFIVCDGMGGHLGGELASRVAINAIKGALAEFFCESEPNVTIVLSDEDIEPALDGSQRTLKLPDSDIDDHINTAILRAHQSIRQLAKARPKEAGDAGTTLTMAYVKGNQAVIANIGDSRTYVIRKHQLDQITKDHSLVGGLLAQGIITEDQIYTHPDRNVIFRSLGQSEDVNPDFFRTDLDDGDVLMLCSDGLWEMLPDKGRIVQIIESSPSLASACDFLVAAANDAGGEDNITVILVRYHG